MQQTAALIFVARVGVLTIRVKANVRMLTESVSIEPDYPIWNYKPHLEK